MIITLRRSLLLEVEVGEEHEEGSCISDAGVLHPAREGAVYVEGHPAVDHTPAKLHLNEENG